MNRSCQICGNEANNSTYVCNERMFGWGDSFTYIQCARCGCLQISQVPKDLSRFYPPRYYSFRIRPSKGFKAWLENRRARWVTTGSSILGHLLSIIRPPPADLAAAGRLKIKKESRILDVGCGNGYLIRILSKVGFRNVEGTDPFLPVDADIPPGLRIRRHTLDDIPERFDLIMLHHVFEHMEGGLDFLKAARRRLTENGKILLRFPTPESAAWERYRENWVGVDCPRHLILHTRTSLGLLARQAGLCVEQVWCDSAAINIWASELYSRGVSLCNSNGGFRDPRSYFTRSEIKEFAQQAERENAAGRGDQLAAVLAVVQDSPG